MPAFRLVMRSAPSAGKVYPLDRNELFVGRDMNNEIVINDPEVSRRHARFFMQGDACFLEDLGSTNGTFINGQRLSAPYPLRVGEAITFGERINLVFEADEQDVNATMIGQRPMGAASMPPPPAQQSAVPPMYPPVQAAQRPAQTPPPPPYAGQVPFQAPPPPKRSGTNLRTIIVILVILFVVVCLCVSAGLYFAPKEFWCMFPVWPTGYCN